MRPSTFICGWASIPETRPPASGEPHSGAPFFLMMAASHTPAQAASTKKILFYLYCLVVYIHLMRRQ
ncbi:MAG TPA: hypothetical protein VGS10_14260 [Terracidiphilus sp.]|nr:hypothetical protein [Terracidiphilus sp.]